MGSRVKPTDLTELLDPDNLPEGSRQLYRVGASDHEQYVLLNVPGMLICCFLQLIILKYLPHTQQYTSSLIMPAAFDGAD